ncbi:MAG: 7-cyano-7-deazaguanine synthase QueC [Candidatus Auribacterota bacterium]|jgi:7-cyano-7-deazaguanine synthase|nr:7-cyano-7-deazaguanine synthase QueC [Candidatus Auribacterota bacterium]
MKNAVVLLSGGLDSYTTANVAKSMNYTIYALSFDYRQRHNIEIQSAANIARQIGVKKHIIIPLDIFSIAGKSALTDSIAVPENRSEEDMSKDIPVTYVPARNTVFLSHALCWAETIPAYDIFIGVNAVDYSGYPDCRPEYIAAFEKMANLATKAGVEGHRITIHTPLINMKKNEIIRKGIELGCDYSLSISCYQPALNGASCGICDSCHIRKKGFKEAGIPDPTPYMES